MKIEALDQSHISQWVSARCQLWPQDNEKEHMAELTSLLGSEKFCAWGAFEDGNLLGFIEMDIRPFANGCESRPVPFLEGVWIEPEHRQKGIARKLFEAAEVWAKTLGHREIAADVDIENVISQKAHNKWGFEETERVVYFRKDLK